MRKLQQDLIDTNKGSKKKEVLKECNFGFYG